MLMNNMSRRKVLRGIVNGVAVGVALPLLDCFLLPDGQALAATGQRIPTRFGTWVWGCGFIPEKWVPTTTGSDYAMPADLAPLEPYRDRLAVLKDGKCVGVGKRVEGSEYTGGAGIIKKNK